jgi:predicted alpha/beta-hydrolase family hydrolase
VTAGDGSVAVSAFLDEAPGGTVRGFVHSPIGPPGGPGLVLTHGAGSNCSTTLLTQLADALAGDGITVLRCDLPFRQSRPRGMPGRGDAARDRAGLARAVAALRPLVTGPILLGGHSYGGRQASMLAAEQPELAAALVLLSYPLHPPRRPTELRTAHFSALRVPALFVHGTRDPFGSIEEMERAVGRMPGRTALITLAGAGHELLPRRAADAHAAVTAIAQRVLAFARDVA